MSDEEVEAAARKCGGRWDGSRWVFEDADLHPFARTLLAAERERCATTLEATRKQLRLAVDHIATLNGALEDLARLGATVAVCGTTYDDAAALTALGPNVGAKRK